MVTVERLTQSDMETIEVTDLDRARAFYEEYFGLTAAAERQSPGATILWRSDDSVEPVVLRFVQRSQVKHQRDLTFEFGTSAEVLDMYLIMTMTGLPAATPRASHGRLSVRSTDPDGHRVVAWARDRRADGMDNEHVER